ncbi:Enhancer of polycomb 2 [Glycine max]|nr:Enhancer of polycomb 2 [Glycine max]
MSRLSFRPRPLDIHKKLPIVKSIKDFDDDEAPASTTRNSQLLRAVPEIENEVPQTPSKKLASEIPTPQFVVVDTYERDYSCTFSQPTSYLRARGARAEIGEFVEYDLDNEDEDWLFEFNEERNILTPEIQHFIQYSCVQVDGIRVKRWQSWWMAVVWSIWQMRNRVIFSNASFNGNKLFEDAIFLLWTWLRNIEKDFTIHFNQWSSQIRQGFLFESLLFKLEVLDHKARERAGLITPTLGSPIPVQLRLDTAIEALQAQGFKYSIIQSVYDYWKEKRERWQKPVLRRLQPPPPVNDTNPYNVFRPREKAHRLHTRRMQRRENNVQSFEKLRQVRRNLDQAKSLLEALIKREEKKREVMDSEVTLQRMQMKYKHETEFLEDNIALSGFTPFTSKFVSSEEEYFDSDDVMTNRLLRTRSTALQSFPSHETNIPMVPAASTKQEFRRRYVPHGWPHKLDPLEPVLLFTKPLLPDKLAMAGIMPPDSITPNGRVSPPPYRYRGRMGRGGRIIFDRWNPLMQTPIDCGNSYYMPPKPRPSTCTRPFNFKISIKVTYILKLRSYNNFDLIDGCNFLVRLLKELGVVFWYVQIGVV